MSESDIEFSRQIRTAILRTLFVHSRAGLNIGYAACDLAGTLAGSIFGRDERLLAGEIADLLERGLIRPVEGAEPPRWVITARGKDFARANHPWGKVDEFTGGQRT
jgi:hypothetical protein